MQLSDPALARTPHSSAWSPISCNESSWLEGKLPHMACLWLLSNFPQQRKLALLQNRRQRLRME